MFDKFGEFGSYEEINRAADAQLAEGDTEALKLLAKENGIDEDDVYAYLNNEYEELCTSYTAAVGKIELEVDEYSMKGTLKDYAEELKLFARDNMDLALAIRTKGKTVAQYMAILIDAAFANRVPVHKGIVEKTTEVKKLLGTHELTEGNIDRNRRYELAKEYFFKKEEVHVSI